MGKSLITSPRGTYKWLLHLGSEGLAAMKRIVMGDGTDTALSVGAAEAEVDGDLEVTGALTVGGSPVALQSEITAAVNALIGGAPGALDTLNELAAALGDDDAFATSVTNALAGKGNLSGGNSWNGVQTVASPIVSAGSLTGAATELPNISQIYQLLTDPDNIFFREEFTSLPSGWTLAVTGTGYADAGGSAVGSTGSMQVSSGITSGSYSVIFGGGISFWPLQHQPWKAEFLFGISDIADMRLRVGFSQGPSTGASLWSQHFSGISYDSSLSPNLRFVNDTGSSPTFTDTGVAAAINTRYRLTMRSNGVYNQMLVSLNGGAETLLTSALDYNVHFSFGANSLSGSYKAVLADFFSYFGTISR